MKLLVSALDHSANIHLKSLKTKLGRHVELLGIFDKSLGNPYLDFSSLSIMGFVDALKKLPFFAGLRNKMVELAQDADKVLLIDGSGFNLPLAKKIRKNYPKKEIIYYILPQAWAWRKGRIPIIEQTINTLASILPFEADFYSENANINYVGHPLLDQITKYKTKITNIEKIAFMPGSRVAEIKRLMPVYTKLRTKIKKEAYLIIPKNFEQKKIPEIYGDIKGFNIVYNAYETLYNCDFAFICSGTATLEAALTGTPFILSYIAKPIDFLIASRAVKIEHIGLANILFKYLKKEALHPEFIQNEVTPENLIDAFKNMDTDNFLEKTIQLRNYLQHGSAANVANLIKKKI